MTRYKRTQYNAYNIYISISYITNNLLIYFHKLQNNYFSYKMKGKKEIFTLILDWYIA